jgi:hypothetical protein
MLKTYALNSTKKMKSRFVDLNGRLTRQKLGSLFAPVDAGVTPLFMFVNFNESTLKKNVSLK